jgi:hypothetical protein
MTYLEAFATISECRSFRYALVRSWDYAGPTAMFVGLNPSTADGDVDDPTLRRCVAFAKKLGYSRLIMANLFAFRTPHPSRLPPAEVAVGPENNRWLTDLAAGADVIIACWGAWAHGTRRAEQVMALLSPLYCLGYTKLGAPRHPLYLKSDVLLRPYRPSHAFA